MRTYLLIAICIVGTAAPSIATDWDLVEPSPFSTNYYERLGIKPTDPKLRDAKEAALLIQAAYRKAALKYHPDRHQEGQAAEQAGLAFRSIESAYSVLKNPTARHFYDTFESIHGSQSHQTHPYGAEVGWAPWAAWFKTRSQGNRPPQPPKRSGAEAKAEAIELIRQAIRDAIDISKAENLFEAKLKSDGEIYQETFVKLVNAMASQKNHPGLAFNFNVEYDRWYSIGDAERFAAFDEVLNTEAPIYAASRPTAEQLLAMESHLQEHFRHFIPLLWEAILSDLEPGNAAKKLIKAYIQAILTSPLDNELSPQRIAEPESKGKPIESRAQALLRLLTRFSERFQLETAALLTEVVEEKIRKDVDNFHHEKVERKTQEALATWNGAWDVLQTLSVGEQIAFLERFAEHFYTNDAWRKEHYRVDNHYRAYPLKTAILDGELGYSLAPYIAKMNQAITTAALELLEQRPESTGQVLEATRLAARLKAHFSQTGQRGREARCSKAFQSLASHRQQTVIPKLSDLENH